MTLSTYFTVFIQLEHLTIVGLLMILNRKLCKIQTNIINISNSIWFVFEDSTNEIFIGIRLNKKQVSHNASFIFTSSITQFSDIALTNICSIYK